MLKNKCVIFLTSSIKEALQKIDEFGIIIHQTLIVVDDQMNLIGVVTEGDIRRKILSGASIDSTVEDVVNKNCFYVTQNDYKWEDLKEKEASDIRLLPVVNSDKKLIRVIDLSQKRSLLPLDVILMAGGEGRRLRPLTEETPKPLLEVNGKPIIQYNLEQLSKYGVYNINISLNYLGEQIEERFGVGSSFDIDINYLYEKEFLGTLGSATLVSSFSHNDILIMNSDLLTNINYEDFYLDFISSGADISIASVPYMVNIPYAVLDLDGARVKGLSEKPEYTFYSSAGIYLVKKELISKLDKHERKDMPDFIEDILNIGHEVRHYPIRGYWLDIGKKEDFYKAQVDVKHILF